MNNSSDFWLVGHLNIQVNYCRLYVYKLLVDDCFEVISGKHQKSTASKVDHPTHTEM